MKRKIWTTAYQRQVLVDDSCCVCGLEPNMMRKTIWWEVSGFGTLCTTCFYQRKRNVHVGCRECFELPVEKDLSTNPGELSMCNSCARSMCEPIQVRPEDRSLFGIQASMPESPVWDWINYEEAIIEEYDL